MDEQVLNKKLAEWRWSKDGVKILPNGNFIYYYTLQYRGKEEKHIDLVPNFPNDLNACFRQLVPKAIDEIMAIHQCSSDVAYGLLFKWWLKELELIIPDAALALCLAINILTNEENNDKDTS